MASAVVPGVTRSLAPREHGAYAQLGLPMVVALAAPLRLSAWLIAAAGALGFLAYEPTLVLLGRRGERARADNADRARVRLLWMASSAAVLGALGLTLASRSAAVLALVPLGLALVVAGIVWRRGERSASGEHLAAVSLSAVALPIAVAGGAAPATALWTWLAWVAALSCGVAAVRGVIASHKRGSVGAATTVVSIAALADLAAGTVRPLVLAAVPMIAVAGAVLWMAPHPRALRAVGWLLAIAGVLVAAALIAFRVVAR